jgi:hypothetical protein
MGHLFNAVAAIKSVRAVGGATLTLHSARHNASRRARRPGYRRGAATLVEPPAPC